MCLLQELAAKYGVLIKDAGIALRGLFLINPEVLPCGPSCRCTLHDKPWCYGPEL